MKTPFCPKAKEGSSGDKYCDYNNLKRARYFHGMLMTDRDFREEQRCHNEKRKLLNRMLQGWGVVCGLKIEPTSDPSSKIVVKPSLALDCAGNKIFVCEPYELDVIGIIKSCVTLKNNHTTPEDCVEIDEDPADPVPVYAPSGGCEEKVCEYSRTREGYCIDLCNVSDLSVECPERFREPKDPDAPCTKYVISCGLLQHWMKLLAPANVPFEAIVDYALLGAGCESSEEAVEAFRKICEKQE